MLHTEQPDISAEVHKTKRQDKKLLSFLKKRVEKFGRLRKTAYLCTRNQEMVADRSDSLAQQVEHNTFNVGVLGSSPKRITKRKAKRRQQKDKSYKINILWDFFIVLWRP